MRYIFCLIMILLICSCRQESTDQLFKPVPKATIDFLSTQGYEWVKGIDLLMYSKTIQDTIYEYQFGNDDSLESQIWRIKNVKINNEKEYKSILRGLNLNPATSISLEDPIAVTSFDYHCTYICRWLTDGELYIIYKHPNI